MTASSHALDEIAIEPNISLSEIGGDLPSFPYFRQVVLADPAGAVFSVGAKHDRS